MATSAKNTSQSILAAMEELPDEVQDISADPPAHAHEQAEQEPANGGVKAAPRDLRDWSSISHRSLFSAVASCAAGWPREAVPDPPAPTASRGPR